ncbi:hypothetical protein ACLOJK_022377 [Asimina triloba]
MNSFVRNRSSALPRLPSHFPPTVLHFPFSFFFHFPSSSPFSQSRLLPFGYPVPPPTSADLSSPSSLRRRSSLALVSPSCIVDGSINNVSSSLSGADGNYVSSSLSDADNNSPPPSTP